MLSLISKLSSISQQNYMKWIGNNLKLGFDSLLVADIFLLRYDKTLENFFDVNSKAQWVLSFLDIGQMFIISVKSQLFQKKNFILFFFMF